MTRGKTLTCIHEPFGDAFYFGPERLGTRYENDEKARQESGFAESTYQTILDRIDQESEEVRYLLTFPIFINPRAVTCVCVRPERLQRTCTSMELSMRPWRNLSELSFEKIVYKNDAPRRTWQQNGQWHG